MAALKVVVLYVLFNHGLKLPSVSILSEEPPPLKERNIVLPCSLLLKEPQNLIFDFRVYFPDLLNQGNHSFIGIHSCLLLKNLDLFVPIFLQNLKSGPPANNI